MGDRRDGKRLHLSHPEWDMGPPFTQNTVLEGVVYNTWLVKVAQIEVCFPQNAGQRTLSIRLIHSVLQPLISTFRLERDHFMDDGAGTTLKSLSADFSQRDGLIKRRRKCREKKARVQSARNRVMDDYHQPWLHPGLAEKSDNKASMPKVHSTAWSRVNHTGIGERWPVA